MNQDGKVEQLTLFSPDICSGKMCQAFSAAENRMAKISASSSKKLQELRMVDFLYLDLRPGFGTLLAPSWEQNSPSLGAYWTHNFGPAPLKEGGASSLSQILEARPHHKYYLSKTACLGILRRAQARGKELPPQLKLALMIQAGLAQPGTKQQTIISKTAGVVSKGNGDCFLTPDTHTSLTSGGGQAGQGYPCVLISELSAFACNQRDEVRDLHNVAGAVQAQPGMKQQTFISQPVTIPINLQIATRHMQLGESTGFGVGTVGDPAYTLQESHSHGVFINHIDNPQHDETRGLFTAGFCAGAAPTAGGIGYQEECAPTLKAGESGTNMVPSILCLNDQGGQRMDVLENQTGTLRACMDGHPPLVMDETYCIAGNIIDREAKNGGNGLGCQTNISYTLTGVDRHAVYSRQRSDLFLPNDVTATQSARQHKDATDLVYQHTVGTLVASDKNGPNNQYVNDDKCIIMPENLIRRLTPLECERLMGFPDYWTDVGNGSDSARYKALGNSVAIPCVTYVMQGIAYFLLQDGGR